MLKKTITYTDYYGTERTEDHRFNLTEAEVIKLNMAHSGGIQKHIEHISNKMDPPAIMKLFSEILHMAYGEISEDGRRFIKSEELSTAFEQTEAYNILFTELCTDAKAAADFINGILPKNMNVEEPAINAKVTAIEAVDTDA